MKTRLSYLVISLLLISIATAQISIENIGIPGINETNPEFTALRTVLLKLNFTQDALGCRYINHDQDTAPPQFTLDWTQWESCVSSRLWEVSENAGMKQVYFQVNYSGSLSTFNDTIYYNASGVGLDLTEPSTPVIDHKAFSNDPAKITFSWTAANDPESAILGIPLKYHYQIYESTNLIASGITQNTTISANGLGLAHLDQIILNLTTINSAGLTSNVTSLPRIIDLQAPTLNNLKGIALNQSNNMMTDVSLGWIHAKKINLTWDMVESTSGMLGVSYVLSTDINADVDSIPDGPAEQLQNIDSVVFDKRSSAHYYFRVKAIDRAGNENNVQTLEIQLDSSPPSAPRIISETSSSTDYHVRWASSIDDQSSVDAYMVNISDDQGNTIDSMLLNPSVREFTFSSVIASDIKAFVGARNLVGLWRWSTSTTQIVDTLPPSISVPPQVTYIARPRLILQTDESSFCSYLDGSWKPFTYSGSTFHEHPIDIDEGSHTFQVQCTDPSGNTASDSITLSYSSMPADDVIVSGDNSCIEQTMFDIALKPTFTGLAIAGVSASDIILTADSENIPFGMQDMGNGVINLSLVCPGADTTYQIMMGDLGPFTHAVTATALTWNMGYADPGISSWDEQSNIVSNIGTLQYGLASTTGPTWVNQAGRFNATQLDSDAQGYIFMTKTFSTSQLNDQIAAQRFDASTNDAFGYDLSRILTRYIIGSDQYNIKTQSNAILDQGTYHYFIEKDIGPDGIPIIYLGP